MTFDIRDPWMVRGLFIIFYVIMGSRCQNMLRINNGSAAAASGSSSSSSSSWLPLLQSTASEVAASASCVDSDAKCALWAGQGECQTNAVWMMANCRRSCQSCQGGDRAWQLRSFLAKHYDNSSASSNATSRIVRVESIRINHIEVDETTQLVRTFGRMVMSWNDSKVTWNKNEWGISWLNFYWIQVWTPQIVQINAPNGIPSVVTGKVLAANHTGQIYMWLDFNFVAPYNFVYHSYPNDEQQICYKFDDKRYFSVRFAVANDVTTRRHEAVSETHVSGWTVTDLQMQHSKYVIQVLGDWRKNPFDVQTSNCELCLTLRRNAIFYFAEMLCPALATSAVTLSATMFALSGTQLALLAFSLSAQLLAMLLLNSRLPYFSDTTPAILRFAGFNFASTALLFVISVALRRLARSTSNIPLPRQVNSVIDLADRWLPFGGTLGGAAAGTNKEMMGDEPAGTAAGGGPYADMAHTFNRIVFAFFTLIYILNIITTFIFG